MGDGAPGMSVKDFIVVHCDFSPYKESYAAAYRFGGSLYCFENGVSEKMASYRTVNG
jgi:hypothetical protein